MHIGIVEDNALMLESLRFLLQGEPGVKSVHAYASAEALLDSRPWPQLDLLLVDLQLPGLSGLELIARVKARQPALNCLAFTGSEDRETIFAAIQSGACGYLVKGSGFRELLSALRSVETGGAPMSPGIARQVLLRFQQLSAPGPIPTTETLSPREQSVLRGLAQGQSYKAIADALGISPHTVNSHSKRIHEKLHVRSREEAVREARQRGLL